MSSEWQNNPEGKFCFKYLKEKVHLNPYGLSLSSLIVLDRTKIKGSLIYIGGGKVLFWGIVGCVKERRK